MNRHIVIVSDVHLGSNDGKGVYGKSPNAGLEHSVEVDKLSLLKTALQQRYQHDKIDLLIFLGDYVTGRDDTDNKEASFNSFLDFLREIESLSSLFHDPDHVRDYIVIVPGNHDIERGSEEPLRKFQECFKDYITPFRSKSYGVCHLGAPLFVYEKQKLLVACISTVNHASTETSEIPQLIETVKHLNRNDEKRKPVIEYLESQQVKDIPAIDAKTVDAFADLSDSFSAKYQDYKDYKKIVVSHHPMISGLEQNIAIKEYPNTIGGYRFRSLAAVHGYTYFLNGHIHDFACIGVHDYTQSPPVCSFHISVPDFKLGRNDSELQVVELTLSDDSSDAIRLLQASSITRNFKEQRLIVPNSPGSDTAGAHSILVDFEIEQLIKDGTVIKHADSARVEAASYDCALGTGYKRAPGGGYDWKDDVLEPAGDAAAEITLTPGETVLIYTEEEFDIPDDMVLHASPISSWARKGLRVELSYFVDPGFKGPFCFPVTNTSKNKLFISSADPIMSVEFVRLSKRVKTPWYVKHPDKLAERAQKHDC